MDELEHFHRASQEAARLGGQVLLKWLGKTSTREKGPRDLVTQADLESQSVIQDFLAQEFPDHHFIGEEDSSPSGDSMDEQAYCWIVDPLDGTTNFVHQLRSFAVSVALCRNNRPVVGTVLDPVLKESYGAILGRGATLNQVPIQTSGCDRLEKSLFVFSLSRGASRDDVEVTRFLNVLENAGSLRRLGSAALNLCYVACGRTDGYWATALQKWDVAAGWLIATEAGATLANFSGGSVDLDNPYFCITASESLYQQVQPLLNV